MDKLNRREAVQTLTTGAAALGLGLALAQNPTPVRITEIAKLDRDWSQMTFDYAGNKALLVRVPKAERVEKRALEVKQGNETLYLTAFQLICTHQGCQPALPDAQHNLVCPCHGSTFKAADGSVVRGPARDPLRGIWLEVREGALFATGFAG